MISGNAKTLFNVYTAHMAWVLFPCKSVETVLVVVVVVN